MLYLDDQEREALARVLEPLSEIMTEIGWHRCLNSLTEREVLVMVEVIIEAFQNALVDQKISIRKADPEVPF